MLALVVLPDDSDDERDERVEEHGEQAPSRWSQRMPTSVAGLALGMLVCMVVIGLCVGALVYAVGFLVRP